MNFENKKDERKGEHVEREDARGDVVAVGFQLETGQQG